MKKVISLFLALLIISTMLSPLIARGAEECRSCVEDQTNTLSDSCISHVQQVNDSLASFKASPTLVFVLPTGVKTKDMATYAHSKFNEFGLDDSDSSYDLLVCLNIEQKNYEIYYGGAYDLDESYLIFQSINVNMFNEEIIRLLKNGEFNVAVELMSDEFQSIMKKCNDGYYEKREAIRERNMTIFKVVAAVVGVVVLAACAYSYKKCYDEITNEKKEGQTMKVSEIAKQCESIKANCDICPCQKSCVAMAEHLKNASPDKIVKTVKEDMSF